MVFLSDGISLFSSAELGLIAQANWDYQPVKHGEKGQHEDGEQHDEKRSAGHWTVFVTRETVEDEAAEAAEADVRGDRGGGHDEDRRRAQADKQQRQRD